MNVKERETKEVSKVNKDLLSSSKKVINLRDNAGLTNVYQTYIIYLMSEEAKMV